MPNQLAQSKKRMTVAEEASVLAALEVIAQADNRTVTDLLRQGARRIIAERVANPELRKAIRRVLEMHAPVMPKQFRSPAKVSKFKRSQREFDQLLKELNLFEAEELQRRNSLTEAPEYVRLTEFTG
jgi:DNA-binding NarL/FixJ family response regulator